MINQIDERLYEGKYITFFKYDFKDLKKPPKTDNWFIYTKTDNFLLGYIKWFNRWRCYAFYPEVETVFEKSCMQDITDFIVKLMDQRKKK